MLGHSVFTVCFLVRDVSLTIHALSKVDHLVLVNFYSRGSLEPMSTYPQVVDIIISNREVPS